MGGAIVHGIAKRLGIIVFGRTRAI